VFADVHFKKRKDKLHPSDEIVRLIEKVNMTPSIVGVINNGTSLESDWLPRFRHMWKRFSKKRARDWQLFYGEIDKVNKEYFEVPGHHPMRKSSISKVLSDGSMTRVLPTEFGHEVESPLNKLTETSSPTEKHIGGFHCMFLNTGDSGKKFLFGKKFGFIRKDDIEMLHGILEQGGRETIYLFLHSPIINSKENQVGKSYQLRVKDWLKNTAKRGLGHDVVHTGGGELIDLLAKHQKNVIIVTSHSHESKFYTIDKNTLIAKQVGIEEFNEELHNSIYIKHLNTPCLGSSRKKNGYISISEYRIQETVMAKSKASAVKTDINEVIKDTDTLKSCLEKHRNLFVDFQRIVSKERQIFEDIKDELNHLEPLFKDRSNKSKVIIQKLDTRLKHSLREYATSHETEVGLLKSSLNSVQEEFNVHGGTIPKIEAVFKDLRIEAGVGPSADYDNVKNVFFEWYKASIIGVNELSQKIIYKENLFDNIEKGIIKEIHAIIKGSKMTPKTRITRLKKVKTDIKKVTEEIDSYFLSTKKDDNTLYSVSEEAKKAIVFLDTVLRILSDFGKVFKEQSVKHK